MAGELVSGLFSRKPKSTDDLEPGQGAVLKLDKGDMAVFRDDNGKLHIVSAACTHLGCIVGWNPTDKTWDCPCHGSRFDFTGAVIAGPAVNPLLKM